MRGGADLPSLPELGEGVRQRVRAGQHPLRTGLDVLADGQRLEQLHLLERAPEPVCARARRARDARRLPAIETVPAAGFSRPVQALNVVVLPAPLGPIRPVIRPAGASSVTRSTATRPPKRTSRSLMPRSADRTAGASAAAAAPPRSRLGAQEARRGN